MQVVLWRIIGKGISSTISISNTMKIIARRKNRNEKGIRAEWFGSKPHSNGDIFSRSSDERDDSNVVAVSTIDGTKIANDPAINIENIY